MNILSINRTAKAVIAALRGGAQTVQDLHDHQQAMYDDARVETIASPVTLTAAIQYVYSRAASARPFWFYGGSFSWDSGAWAGGETVDINIQTSTDGVNWVDAWNAVQLAAAPAVLEVAVPHQAMTTLLGGIPYGCPILIGAGKGVRVGIVQTGGIGAGWHVVSHNLNDGVPGS